MIDHHFDDNTMDCLSDEIVTLWSQGLLSAQDRIKVQEHLQRCALCRDLLSTLSEVKNINDDKNEFLVPQTLSEAARQMIKNTWENQIGIILLKISKGVYDAVETTGRVLFAQWVKQEHMTRANSHYDSSAVVIETTYRGMSCVIESIRLSQERHTLKAVFCWVNNGQPIDQTLFVLYEDGAEIESQMSVQGVVIFEDLPMGTYRMVMHLPDKSKGHLDFHLTPA